MRDEDPDSAARVCIAGALALALAMGFGRFAFTPLLPLMVRDGLLPGSEGAWLATANYVGYLAGALWLAMRPISSMKTMRWSVLGTVLVTVSMGVCSHYWLWIVLRFVAGILSACALVATSAWALERLIRAQRPSLAGFVYAGVGLGITTIGAFCLMVATTASSAQVWIELGILAGFIACALLITLPPGQARDDSPAGAPEVVGQPVPGVTTLVVCYGMYGFGYVIPATFLPAMARALIDSPSVFGLPWPLYGLASIVSTLFCAKVFANTSRMALWSACGIIMGVGALVPAVWPTLPGVMLSAVLVGGTFLTATMAGLQEARAKAPQAPTRLLGRMTSAFAFGQVLGPACVATMTYFRMSSVMSRSLGLSAAVLLGSAAILWFEMHRRKQSRSSGAITP